ncbi:hypothetical protein AWC38_SpisGene7462 [Stylophora pistillata]|uniref:Uncharacterized protein n=1 Tax=Stylophora pistillata TaxID=50429 RepID=A0A2B4SG77_STYPI|nr:hypothetical protein AWC38_SpisGene7462 [Stylophora pistillata]
MAENLPKIQASRGGYRSHLTQTLKKADIILNKESPTEVHLISMKNILEQLLRKKNILREMDEKIATLLELSDDREKEIFDSKVEQEEIDKTSWQITQLVGDASRVVAGFPLTNDNYEQAVNLFRERFGQPNKMISAHMQALQDLPHPTYQLSSLQLFYDTMENHVRRLDSLGRSHETYRNLLVPIVLGKLPSDMRTNLACDHDSTGWRFQQLRESILKQIGILQVGVHTNLPKGTLPGTSATVTNTFLTLEAHGKDRSGSSAVFRMPWLVELGPRQLTHEILSTFMAEVTAIVNARPIAALPSDLNDPQPLSPAMLLTMKTRPPGPPPGQLPVPGPVREPVLEEGPVPSRSALVTVAPRVPLEPPAKKKVVRRPKRPGPRRRRPHEGRRPESQ